MPNRFADSADPPFMTSIFYSDLEPKTKLMSTKEKEYPPEQWFDFDDQGIAFPVNQEHDSSASTDPTIKARTIEKLNQKIEKKDLAIKALVMWITTDLSNALDDSFTLEELREIHATTDDPEMQQKPIDEIIRDGLYAE